MMFDWPPVMYINPRTAVGIPDNTARTKNRGFLYLAVASGRR
jgi:hypothetical protein